MKTEPTTDPKVKEYVKSLPKNELEILTSLYRHQANLGDITDFISKNDNMDQWLKSANGSIELFQRIDDVGYEVERAINSID